MINLGDQSAAYSLSNGLPIVVLWSRPGCGRQAQAVENGTWGTSALGLTVILILHRSGMVSSTFELPEQMNFPVQNNASYCENRRKKHNDPFWLRLLDPEAASASC